MIRLRSTLDLRRFKATRGDRTRVARPVKESAKPGASSRTVYAATRGMARIASMTTLGLHL